jgi:hypothetical protein
MRKKAAFLCLFVVLSIGCTLGVNTAQSAQTSQVPSVNSMNITGEIALMAQGYIIRGKTPAEIFTILNPNPDVLDKIIAKGKDVDVLVRIVSGDNVEIEEIDGKNYQK